MRDEFSVEFIEGEPPPSSAGSRTLPLGWLGYVAAVVQTTPNRWALVHGVPFENAAVYGNRLVEQSADLGVTVEAVTRYGVLYVRAVA